ncbi:MAG: hypothetical protein CVU97_05965 [Firmicutes bacterium HGW-Firmicutes-21]|nr:MAG: hypothetical protein CVU97_05965 [Firmicutes bacterium HGW-Firmicutes-21]
MSSITIERIEIVAFGKLKMTQVTPEKGINLLSAPNESGKSTLAAFLKFIFYGYTNGRVQSIIDNDKKLYTPWDNPQSEGAVYINTDSGRYKIERKYLQSGKETLEVFETRSGRPLNTDIPGEYFFGVNEQVFEKTAFFRQLTLPSGKDEYIAEQLQNIAMSADEKINTSKALKRLTDARNMLLGRTKSGLIPKLESEREELELKLTESMAMNKQIQELSDKIAEMKRFVADHDEKIRNLNNERDNIIKYEAFQRLTQLRDLERNQIAAKKDYEEAVALLKQEELPDSQKINTLMTLNADYKSAVKAMNKTYDDLQAEEKELEKLQSGENVDRSKAEEVKNKANKKNTLRNLSLLVSILFAIGGVLITWWLLLLTAVALIPAVIITISLKKLLKTNGVKTRTELIAKMSGYPMTEQRIADKKNKVNALNAAYSEITKKTDEMKKQLESCIREYTEIDRAMSYDEQIVYISDTAQKIRQKRIIYKEKSEAIKKAASEVDINVLAEAASGAVRPEREKAQVDKEISFYTKQKQIFSERERENEGQKRYLEGKGSDPAVILGKRDAVRAQLEEYRRKHASLELALSILNEASDYMKSTVAPRINEYASRFFGNATYGKYATLSVDTAMAMSFSDATGIKSCDYLSAGTRDSAYLCLRLALIRLLYGGVNPPLILDDAFGRVDDKRLEAILMLLSETDTDYQTFIFTCGDREQKILEGAGKAYTLLSLQQK